MGKETAMMAASPLPGCVSAAEQIQLRASSLSQPHSSRVRGTAFGGLCAGCLVACRSDTPGTLTKGVSWHQTLDPESQRVSNSSALAICSGPAATAPRTDMEDHCVYPHRFASCPTLPSFSPPRATSGASGAHLIPSASSVHASA